MANAITASPCRLRIASPTPHGPTGVSTKHTTPKPRTTVAGAAWQALGARAAGAAGVGRQTLRAGAAAGAAAVKVIHSAYLGAGGDRRAWDGGGAGAGAAYAGRGRRT